MGNNLKEKLDKRNANQIVSRKSYICARPEIEKSEPGFRLAAALNSPAGSALGQERSDLPILSIEAASRTLSPGRG